MNYDECEHGEHRPECAECKHTYVVTDDMRDRDARWLRAVRRLWRQRDTLSALVKQDCADLVQSQNAYEDEHRRATLLQERVTWLESQRQWVDVREVVPRDDQHVLAYWAHDKYMADIGWPFGGEPFGADNPEHPTHWQPLPGPPEEPCDD